jgi:nitrogen fixation/metabolism regulation signal transduction histidine kinase
VQYRLEAHNITAESNTGKAGSLIVHCASNLIIGAMINIIDNSIWWTVHSDVPNRSIYIKATDEINGAPAIIIADNGCGFKLSPEDMIKPFVTTKPNGMGLGLNIVNEILLSQGGLLVFPNYGDVKLPAKFKNGAIIALVFSKL